MNALTLVAGIGLSALVTMAGVAQAATFVYVSNAEDGNIGTYTLGPDGTLQPGPRVEAGKPVMPMSVSPDKHFVIDTHPRFPQVSVACGFSGHGFKFAPTVGEILADLAERGTTPHRTGLFSATRFR